ncbi:MAG: hypothetical protein JW712_05005 [Dehalococcoidales bacterium]|nr:hypothetical protein [Dehalococcoidales bacterium]
MDFTNKKIWLYPVLLIVVLALTGFGIWFVISHNSGNGIRIPADEAMVLADFNVPEIGTTSQLSIYKDGTVIHVQDAGLEVPVEKGDEYTRTWRTGKIDPADIDDFFTYLQSLDFNEIEYAFLSPNIESNAEKNPGLPSFDLIESDDYVRIFADNGVVNNTIYAIGFFESESVLYSELPYPVNLIYSTLADIIDNNTKEAMVEHLTK